MKPTFIALSLLLAAFPAVANQIKCKTFVPSFSGAGTAHEVDLTFSTHFDFLTVPSGAEVRAVGEIDVTYYLDIKNAHIGIDTFTLEMTSLLQDQGPLISPGKFGALPVTGILELKIQRNQPTLLPDIVVPTGEGTLTVNGNITNAAAKAGSFFTVPHLVPEYKLYSCSGSIN